jgi:Domain of unknown function (DUF6894)
MALYYFHLTDGATILDNEGSDLPDLAAVRRAAIATTTDILGGMKAETAFWSGEPWKLWVTDKPNGDGATLLTMQFTATESYLRTQEKKPVAASDVRELMAVAADKRG